MSGWEQVRRRRGRPLKDPERGPISDAVRSAAYRGRKRDEVEALTTCISWAIAHLDRHGDIMAVAFMFHAIREPALAAIRRLDPRYARQLEAKVAQAMTEWRENNRFLKGPEPERGARKGSIVVEGRTFWLQPDGTVMRDGHSTGLRVNKEYNCWIVVDPSDIGFRPRRHYGPAGGSSLMALFDAARIAQARDAKEG